MNIRNLTLEEINSAPATKVAEWLAEYNKWRRGEPPYSWGGDKMPFTPSELGAIITRAVELLGKPLRNCDVGTAEEQFDRQDKYCMLQDCHKCYTGDAAYECTKCYAKWSQEPYKKGDTNEQK
jgi:hypothetical protein